MSCRAGEITRDGHAKNHRRRDLHMGSLLADEREGPVAPHGELEGPVVPGGEFGGLQAPQLEGLQAPQLEAPPLHLYDNALAWVFFFLALPELGNAACVSRQWRRVATQGPAHANNAIVVAHDSIRFRAMLHSPVMQRHVTSFHLQHNFRTLDGGAFDGLVAMKNLREIDFNATEFRPELPVVLSRVCLDRVIVMRFAKPFATNDIYWRAFFALGCTLPLVRSIGPIVLDAEMLGYLCTRVPDLRDLRARVIERALIAQLHRLPISVTDLSLSNGGNFLLRWQHPPLDHHEFASLGSDRLELIETNDYGWAPSMVTWLMSATHLTHVNIIRPTHVPDFSTLVHPRICSFRVIFYYMDKKRVWSKKQYPKHQLVPQMRTFMCV